MYALVAAHNPLGYDQRMSIPSHLHAWRESRRLTVEELAQQCCLSAETVRDIESGATDPSLSTLDTLAAALGVPPSWLYGDPRDLQLLTQYLGDEDEPERAQSHAQSPSGADPVVERMLRGLRQDRTLYTLVTVLLHSEDQRLIRAAEVSLRSLVKQVKPINVPWAFRQPGNFEPPSD